MFMTVQRREAQASGSVHTSYSLTSFRIFNFSVMRLRNIFHEPGVMSSCCDDVWCFHRAFRSSRLQHYVLEVLMAKYCKLSVSRIVFE